VLIGERHVGLAAAGVALGVGAVALSPPMASMPFGVTATAPLTCLAVSGGLAAVALGAGYLPARRDARMNPIAALRLGT
jgi:ABC-type antimicrobial peptide transport system permease subunit